MIVTCEKCQKRYSIADDRGSGAAVKIRCSSCQSVIHLRPRPKDPSPGRTAAHTHSAWFAVLKGKQAGPLSEDQLGGRVLSGQVTAKTFIWRKGMKQWKRAADLPELSGFFSQLLPPAGIPPLVVDTSPPRPEPFEAPPLETSGMDAADEDTQGLLNLSGVAKKHSLLTIAALIGLLAGLSALFLFVRSSGRVSPLPVGARANSSGGKVETLLPPKERASAVGDLLLGRKRENSVRSAAPHRPNEPGASKAASSPVVRVEPDRQTGDLQTLYREGAHTDVGPQMRKGIEEKVKDSTENGLSEKDVARIVAQAQSAFQFCIEQELKKNPFFRGGKIFVTATVGGSGIVKSAGLSRRDIEVSPLGACLKSKAKRMVFPAFTGEDAEVQVPLILTTGLP